MIGIGSAVKPFYARHRDMLPTFDAREFDDDQIRPARELGKPGLSIETLARPAVLCGVRGLSTAVVLRIREAQNSAQDDRVKKFRRHSLDKKFICASLVAFIFRVYWEASSLDPLQEAESCYEKTMRYCWQC
jgi:hypothetical protein